MPNARRILIVDDDTELREALVEQLSLHEEFDAIAAESGTKGVQAAKGGQVDLVIMDVGLPGRAAPAATVELLRNGEFYDRAIADHSGQFVMVPPRLLPGDNERVSKMHLSFRGGVDGPAGWMGQRLRASVWDSHLID